MPPIAIDPTLAATFPWPPEQAQPGVSKPCRTTGFVLSTLLATIALFAASTVSAHAQSTDWTGQFSSNWFLTGNWIGGISQADERRKHQHCDVEFDGDQ